MVVALLTIFCALGSQLTARASGKQTTLTIVKYGLKPGSTGFSSDQTINTGEPINNLPTDDHGNELSPMEGIHYKVQEIVPVNGDPRSIKLSDPSTYKKVGVEYDIVTNAKGIATISVNPNGDFIVSEQANKAQHLSNAAAPLLIELPVANAAGTANLDDVYIYPKSSIDPEETKPPLSSGVNTPLDNGSGSKQPGLIGLLPRTGDTTSWLIMFSGVILLFLLFVLRRKNKKDKVED